VYTGVNNLEIKFDNLGIDVNSGADVETELDNLAAVVNHLQTQFYNIVAELNKERRLDPTS
jgi:hypothetical protein